MVRDVPPSFCSSRILLAGHTRWISVVERDSGDLSLAPTGMDERTEKPKRWVGQRGGEHSVFFISFLRKAPIGLFRGAYRF